jgi:hypothetical protein
MLNLVTYISGPLFDTRMDRAIDEYCRDVRSDLATRGLVGVMTVLASPHPTGIRKRTPFYETQLNISGDPLSDDSLTVNDNDVIYGHWLNGTGTRNWPVTRFRGYAAWSKSFGRLNEAVPTVIARHMAPALRKMN